MLHPDIRAALDSLPVPYTIVKKRDHTFAVVTGFTRVLVYGNHPRMRKDPDRIRETLRRIEMIRRALSGVDNERQV